MAFKESLLHLIENPKMCDDMRKKAYDFGRKMIWKNIGKQYNMVFTSALKNYNAYPRNIGYNLISFQVNCPEVKLDYLKLLTDDVGIMQHTNLGVPARPCMGYSTG